jgi:tetratricopeptide (TPR) repeat protein
MTKTIYRNLFVLAFCSVYLFADHPSLALDKIGSCDEIKDATPFVVDEQNDLFAVHESNNSQNPFLYVYLRNQSRCRVVLSIQGSSIEFIKISKSEFPDIKASWHMGADKSDGTLYIWNGDRYISREARDSERLNKEALEYFKKGNIAHAITIWEKAKDLAIIPGLGFTSNAEVLNNLGFAYYKLAQKTHKADYYKRAEYYLDGTIQVDYSRWEAHLNLADLYSETDLPRKAVESYEKALELNPKYKYADKIRDKIRILQGKIKNTDE